MQVLVVVDKEMIEFHHKEHVEEYVLTVMNMVRVFVDLAVNGVFGYFFFVFFYLLILVFVLL